MPAPYDSAQTILNVARERLLDAQITPTGAPAGQTGGEVLSTTGASASYTKVAFNAAYRRMQEFLAANNFSRLISTTILSAAAAVTTTDPGVNCYLNWNGFFDGTTLQPSPTLPADLITPYRLKERKNGASGAAMQFTPMEYDVNGLTGTLKRNRNYNWLWDNDSLVMPGSTDIMDFELRYAAYLADLNDNTPIAATPWYNQLVPIVRCQDALAWYICSEYANARGDVDGAAFDTKAEAAAMKLVQREQQNDALRSEWTVPDLPAQAGNTPYDTVSTIWNAVRVRLNSSAKVPADILSIAQPFAQQCFNNGYRKFQEFLANMGYTRVKDEVIITNIPPTVATDPAIQVYLSWAGYYNGATLNTGLVLPPDLMFPLRIWERITGQNALFCEPGMEQILDGLPTVPQQGYNRMWDWRVDAIYMPGATQATDLRILYAKYLADFVQVGSAPWYLAQVPIARCLDPLSLYVCAEIATARPDLEIDPLTFIDKAEAAAKLVFNRDARMKQRVNVRRKSRSGQLEMNRGYGTYN